MKRVLLGFILLISNILWAQQGISSQEKRDNMYLFKAENFNNYLFFEDGECFSYFKIKTIDINGVQDDVYYYNLQPHVVNRRGYSEINVRLSFQFLISKKIKGIINYYHAREQPESGRCKGVNAIERDHTITNNNLSFCSTMNSSSVDNYSSELKMLLVA